MIKTKFILLPIMIFIAVGNLFGQNWNRISKEIRRKQLIMQPEEKIYINWFYDLRENSGYLNKFSPTMQNDTVYIIESFGGWTSSILVLIAWNKSDTVYCISDNIGETYSIKENKFFTKQMMKLVSDWDIGMIRREEYLNGFSFNSDTDFVTRIIFNGKKYKIAYIYFRDFFDIKRDRK